MEPTDTTSDSIASLDSAPSARFIVEEPGHPPRVVLLARGKSLRIGRGEDQDVRLDDLRTSRQHAQLFYRGDHVLLRDLGSSNGTWLDDRKVTAVSSVAPGSIVRVGSTRVVYVPLERSKRAEPAEPVDGDVVAADPATQQLFAMVRRLASHELPVLVQGETGSGKEVVARLLHRASARAKAPFVAINCASLPESLAESELFGHERGSFTGAVERKAGVFEAAHGGVLLLDEVGELSASNQARLLRVLEERAVVRIGATQPTAVDVRVVAATNRDLAAELAHGRFREDLYFRLNGVTVTVPPLRERPRDIIPLAERVIAERGGGYVISPEAADVLVRYEWPGNARELRNAIEGAIAMADGGPLRPEHLPATMKGKVRPARDEHAPLRSMVDEVEREAIASALQDHGGNQSHAAVTLGISRRALIYKMERYGLKAPPRRISKP
ncbi:MAG: sigma 54-interacting transcriptional regulator [Polyangiales bacterium]